MNAMERHLADLCIPQQCTWCLNGLHPADCGCSDCRLEREERAIDEREMADFDDYMEGGAW